MKRYEKHVNNVSRNIPRCRMKLATTCKKHVFPAASQALVPSNPRKFFHSDRPKGVGTPGLKSKAELCC
jgi:hypothetical protein